MDSQTPWIDETIASTPLSAAGIAGRVGPDSPSPATSLGQTLPRAHIPGDGDILDGVTKHHPLRRRCPPGGTEGDFAPDIAVVVLAHLRSRPLLRRVTASHISSTNTADQSSDIEKVRRNC